MDPSEVAPLLDTDAGHVDAVVWAVGDGGEYSPVFAMARADEVFEHLVEWSEGSPVSWFKLVDDRPIDPIALLTVVDTLPPVTFEMGMPGWAPTLELTVHVRTTPAPGLLRIRHETRNFAGGFFEEDCEVWDSAGRLVAQSRQLALQPKV